LIMSKEIEASLDKAPFRTADTKASRDSRWRSKSPEIMRKPTPAWVVRTAAPRACRPLPRQPGIHRSTLSRDANCLMPKTSLPCF